MSVPFEVVERLTVFLLSVVATLAAFWMLVFRSNSLELKVRIWGVTVYMHTEREGEENPKRRATDKIILKDEDETIRRKDENKAGPT